MGETEEFNTLAFEKRLMQLKDTQESIQSLSSWCLKQRNHHKKIVSSWLNVLKRVKVEQRLTLFYLANDVIQYSKRKNYEFVESWGLNLQKATPLVRDDKVKHKILRIFKIWEQRSVYDEEFLSDLTGLLSAGAIKKTDDDPFDFQPQQLVNKIKQCAVLESDTDAKLKNMHDSHLQLSDAEALCANLKERSLKDDVEKELNEGISCVERYTQALQREIVAREALLALLTSANQYYTTQWSEVKVVDFAYKSFGNRVRTLKRKLDDLIPTLPNSVPSPPQRDEDVPSPSPDEDIDLPAPSATSEDEISYNIDRTFNSSMSADGSIYNLGLSSFLNSDNALALFNGSDLNISSNANKIEVINNRPTKNQDFNINEFLKTLIPNDTNIISTENVSVTSGSQKSQDTLPGLDLLTPDSTGNPPPPTSFYGTMDNVLEDPDQPYQPEPVRSWSNNAWMQPPAPIPPPIVLETPESPPPGPPLPTPQLYASVPTYDLTLDDNESQDRFSPSKKVPPPSDVDHRGILPPPPPPPVLPLLGRIEDVDHRLLGPPPVAVPPPLRHQSLPQDVDHRNLIPLTHQPPSPRLTHPAPMPVVPVHVDQDYRVPPMVPPTDIVESVDMDLSEDEEQSTYLQPELTRRQSFNNKVLVGGGSNGKTNHNLIQINSTNKPHSAPVLTPSNNPFESMPPVQENYNNQFQNQTQSHEENEEKSNDSYEEDLRSRGLDQEIRNPSPPFEQFPDWHGPPRPFMNPRFPRNWGPRTIMRPMGPLWPRLGPRPPNRRPGLRPHRFW